MEVLIWKSSINGPFSMAMLNNQRVDLKWLVNSSEHEVSTQWMLRACSDSVHVFSWWSGWNLAMVDGSGRRIVWKKTTKGKTPCPRLIHYISFPSKSSSVFKTCIVASSFLYHSEFARCSRQEASVLEREDPLVHFFWNRSWAGILGILGLDGQKIQEPSG